MNIDIGSVTNAIVASSFVVLALGVWWKFLRPIASAVNDFAQTTIELKHAIPTLIELSEVLKTRNGGSVAANIEKIFVLSERTEATTARLSSEFMSMRTALRNHMAQDLVEFANLRALIESKH